MDLVTSSVEAAMTVCTSITYVMDTVIVKMVAMKNYKPARPTVSQHLLSAQCISSIGLPPGMIQNVTCELTACTPGSAKGTTLGNEYGKILLQLLTSSCCPT